MRRKRRAIRKGSGEDKGMQPAPDGLSRRQIPLPLPACGFEPGGHPANRRPPFYLSSNHRPPVYLPSPP